MVTVTVTVTVPVVTAPVTLQHDMKNRDTQM